MKGKVCPSLEAEVMMTVKEDLHCALEDSSIDDVRSWLRMVATMDQHV